MNHPIARWRDVPESVFEALVSCWPVLILVVIHEVLGQVLVTRNVVAVLLSPGARTPWLEALAALIFVALRLVVLCAIPTWIAFRITRRVARVIPFLADAQLDRTNEKSGS